MGQEKPQQRVLRPVAVIAAYLVRLGQKGTVAAMGGLDQGDIWIRLDLLAALGREQDEGVVECVKDKRRHCDTIENAIGRGAGVVVVRA